MREINTYFKVVNLIVIFVTKVTELKFQNKYMAEFSKDKEWIFKNESSKICVATVLLIQNTKKHFFFRRALITLHVKS